MFARLLLGYVIALPFVIPQAARYLETPYTIAVTMQSPISGPLQVFLDAGGGFSERPFSTVSLYPSDKPFEYRLRLQSGRYVRLRLDPGTTGARYTIVRAAILAPDGSLYAPIPLAELVPLSEMSVVELVDDRLIVEAPSGSTDPQLVYAPDVPVFIPRHVFNVVVPGSILLVTLLWMCGIGVVWLIELVFVERAPLAPLLKRLAALCQCYPRAALGVTALVATIGATYPVLLSGRSLFTPNNGGIPQLYGEPPFTPGSSDVLIEDVRGSDVWAAMLQDVPHSSVQRDALAQGEIPLWNRNTAAGRPLWGQGLSYMLDPLHWLTLVTPDPALGWDLKFITHRFLFALGVGLVGLATTGRVFPAMLVAASTPFAGVYAFRLNHIGNLGLTYSPWALLGWFRLSTATNRRSRARAAVCVVIPSTLLMFASNPKDAAITLPALALTGAIAIVSSGGSWSEQRRRLFAGALGGAVVILVTAPHWLVFLETMNQAVTMYDQPYVDFAKRQHAVGFFLGPLTGGPVLTGLHLPALVLILGAITSPRQFLERRPVLASGIVAASLIAIAFGALPASLLVRIPLIRNIHHMHDTFLTAALPLMLVVAVHGADVLRRSGARHVTFVAVITGIVSWWLYTNVGKYLRPDGFAPGAVLLMAPVAVAIPWCFYARQLNPGRVLPRIALAGALVAVLAPGGLHLESGIPRVDELLMQPRFRAALSQDSPAVETVRRTTTVEPMRAAGINWTLVEGSHPFYGLEGIGGADPMEVPVYRSLVDATGIWRSLWLTIVRNGDVGRLSPLLDMLNVGFLVGRSDIPLPDQVVEIPVGGPDRLRVGRRPSAWPRAFFVDGVTTYTDVADLLNQVAAAGSPFAAVHVGDSEALDATRAMLIPSGNALAATRYKLTANTTTFTIRAPRAGVAVLSEAFFPDDFHATLNGSRVPYFRVNQAFKGVTIPSGGDWTVKFEYRPARWELSLGLAGLGVILLSGLGVAAMAPRGAVKTKLMESPAVPVSS